MAPSVELKHPVSFRKLVELKSTGTDTYESIHPAWPQGQRAFGGCCYAQAAYAASQTVASGMVMHNVTGWFILPGRTDVPFTYKVRRVRDGGSYCLRSVDVFQGGTAPLYDQQTPCFVCTVSFKRRETNLKFIEYAHQEVPRDHVRKTYSNVLGDKDPLSHALSEVADDLLRHHPNTQHVDLDKLAQEFPGVEIRKVDMQGMNRLGAPGSWRQLCFYRLIVDKDDGAGDVSLYGVVAKSALKSEELNLHACAHLYASDRNGLFVIQRAHGFEWHYTQMGSLSHTVIFQGVSENVRMTDEDGKPKWFVQEVWTTNTGGNRGTVDSRLWDWTLGSITATTTQDGMVRILKKEDTETATQAQSSSQAKTTSKL